MSNHKHKKSKKDKTQKDYGSNYGSIVENADTKTRASHAAPSEAASSFRHGTQHGGSQAPRSEAQNWNMLEMGHQPNPDHLRAFAELNYANGMRDVFTMDYSGRGRLEFPEGGGGVGVMANPFAMGGMQNNILGGGVNGMMPGQFPMMYGMTPYCPFHPYQPDMMGWMGMYGCQDPWGFHF